MNDYELQFEIDPVTEAVEESLWDHDCRISRVAGISTATLVGTAVSGIGASESAARWLEQQNVTVRRLQMDLVNQSAIADRAGVTRAAVSKWVSNPPSASAGFPGPAALTAQGALWGWGEINEWLRSYKTSQCDEIRTPLVYEVERFNTQWSDRRQAVSSTSDIQVPSMTHAS